MKTLGKFILYLILAALLSLSVFRCEKEVTKVRSDEDAPVLETEPAILEINGISAKIYWVTDEPCSVNVRYGLVTETDTLTRSDSEFRQIHTVTLTDLLPNSEYFYLTLSYDVAGNSTVSPPETFTTPGDTVNYINYGWDAFENDNFADARGFFTDYLAAFPENAEALTGYGWALTRLDSFAAAIDQYSLATELDEQYTDAYSGISLAFYLDSNYTDCINSIEYLQELDDHYIFIHDTTYTYVDTRLMLLDSYVQSTLIDEAVEMLDSYYPDFTLDPNDSSWVVADSVYDTIDDALLHTVQLIISDIWSDGFP